MQGDKFHLVKYEWEGNLFDKQGISKSAIFGKKEDAVISCSLSGRKAYLHSASGLAFVKDDLGKAVENVVEGVSWEGPWYIKGDSIDKFTSSLAEMDDFSLGEVDVGVEIEHNEPSSIAEAVDARKEYAVLKYAVLERHGEPEIELYRGSIFSSGLNCPRILRQISHTMSV